MELLSILQQTTPDTVDYMIAGYVVIFGVIGLYLASYLIRNRNLKRDLELLEEIDQD